MTSSNNSLTQWVSKIVAIESRFEEDYKLIDRLVGPPEDRTPDEQDFIQRLSNLKLDEASNNTKENSVQVQIKDKVFIDSVNIYGRSSVNKIEAKENDGNWICLWSRQKQADSNYEENVFQPTITPTPFRCDTLKFSTDDGIGLIDAIEVKGSLSFFERTLSIDNDYVNSYGQLSRQLQKLITNDLFADVYFEVDGRRVAAHRNILSCRSEYFEAMIGPSSKFRESNQDNPIYIPNMSYDVFIQVLNFIYTGHIDKNKLTCNIAVNLSRAADLLNMSSLEELVLYHLSEAINEDNVITIYREVCETLPILTKIEQLCYDVMRAKFSRITTTEEFCSLPQDLMLKIIENVVTKLPSSEPSTNSTQPQSIRPNNHVYDDDDDVDTDDDSDD